MLRQPGQPAVFFAGGSGIAPIYSLVRQALANNASKICLFYANRDHGTAMLLEELEALQRSYGQRMDLRCWYDVHHGLPTVQALEACTEEFESNDVYLCGPEPFMGAVQSALLSVGVKLDHIRREEFSQDSIDEEPLGHTEFNQSSKTRLTVRIKGQVHQLDVCKTDTLLAAMIKSGLPAPHACKVGECASCMCHIESGDVDRLSNSVLDDDDVAAGWLVACRTRAISDEVSIRYG
jgi:3-ketosteroid 9alpha-monooxygenase subunit B